MELKQLEAQALEQVAAVAEDPQARYDLRSQWYRQFGFGGELDPEGFGDSELAFLRWELERGVLVPLDRGGSRWWRACQTALSYNAILAGLVHTEGCDEPLPAPVQRWLDYIQDPGPKRWYQAHNTSIITAYQQQTVAAHEENPPEQAFLNEVLYRLLYAQALVEGAAMGIVGEVAADPRLFAVDIITQLQALYPRHYPLDHRDVEYVRHVARGPMAELADVLDLDLILPNIDALYDWAQDLNQTPGLTSMLVRSRPIYPHEKGAKHPEKPRKVAVLGGGMSALAAVHELTRYPDWHFYYEIDLYQLGWRLGGKTATGRGANNRIEERGLHIFQGWYDNAFRLIQETYAERRARGLAPDNPFQDWEQAFLRNDGTILTEHLPDRGWVPWPIVFPRTSEMPGFGPPPTVWEQIRKVLALLLETLFGSPYAKHFLPFVGPFLEDLFPAPRSHREGMLANLIEGVEHVVDEVVESLFGHDHEEAHRLAQHLASLVGRPEADSSYQGRDLTRDATDSVLSLIQGIVDTLAHLVEELGDHLRRTLLVAELGVIVLRGVIADCWTDDGFDFNAINHLDFRAWLAKHGANEQITYSVVVRFFYTGTFANQAGGDQTGGLMAAGLALRGVLAAFGYKGSFVWQTRAGTGDTLVMPIYQVLAARGVRFHWFHKVREIPYADADTVDTVHIDIQADLADPDTPYQPSFPAPYGSDGASVDAWPIHPRYEQLDPAQAAQLQERGIDLEDPWSGWEPVGSRTLKRGRDFDDLILAIPIAATAQICSGFRADERWAAMFDSVKTTMTMAAQIYFLPTLGAMGYHAEDWGMAPKDCALNLVTYAEPQYSWVDTSQVLPAEQWPSDNQPQAIGLFCGSMLDPVEPIPPYSDHAYPKRLVESVSVLTRQWCNDNMGWFLPGGAPRGNPAGFDFAKLADGQNRTDATRNERWNSQYFWVNAAPDLRYTLSVPGSNRHRMKTDATGFGNLFLAGDWIDFGVNVGYMEGTVISGLQAAQALMKHSGGRLDTQPIWESS